MIFYLGPLNAFCAFFLKPSRWAFSSNLCAAACLYSFPCLMILPRSHAIHQTLAALALHLLPHYWLPQPKHHIWSNVLITLPVNFFSKGSHLNFLKKFSIFWKFWYFSKFSIFSNFYRFFENFDIFENFFNFFQIFDFLKILIFF